MLLTVLTNITTIFVNIDEFPQRFDNVNVLPGPCNDKFRALVETVVQNFERLEDVSPVLALVIQTLIEHVHDLVEIAGTALRKSSTIDIGQTYLLKVRAAISLMSVPVGPQGSLEVAVQCQYPRHLISRSLIPLRTLT